MNHRLQIITIYNFIVLLYLKTFSVIKIIFIHRYHHWQHLFSRIVFSLLSMSQVTVKKCGLRFEPPAIVLIYSQQSLFGTQLRMRTIPAKEVKTTPVSTIARSLKSCERHRQYLEQVPDWQIEKLLKMLKENFQGRRKEDIIRDVRTARLLSNSLS